MNVNEQNDNIFYEQHILDLLVWDNHHILARIKEMSEQVKTLTREVTQLRKNKNSISPAKLANDLESRLGPWVFRAVSAYYNYEEENEYYEENDYKENYKQKEQNYCTCTSNKCSIRHHIWE